MIRFVIGETPTGESMHVAREADRASVVDAALRGSSFLVTVADNALAASLYDELRRIASVRTLPDDLVDDEQRRLLELIAQGHTVAASARHVGMSCRTAHRRLAEARAALGADTNVAAIAELTERGAPLPD